MINSSYTLTMFGVMSTLLSLLQPIVSRPILIKFSEEENQDQKKNNNVDGFHSSPPSGDGNFRDPLEILGVGFTESKTVHLCKANLYMYADSVTDVTFPKDATRLCASVCRAYQDSMYLDQSVTVSLINSNCDYTGDTVIEERPACKTGVAKCPDLSTACVCAYNVRCNRKTRLVTYTLTPNERGYLKVLAADCETSAGYDTRTLSPVPTPQIGP